MPKPEIVEAMAKAEEKAKTVDYYADLTDEERAEEGLPPREPSKTAPETAPGDKPASEPKPEETEVEEAEPLDDDATERLFEEIAGLREDLGTALSAAEPEAEKKDKDPLLEAALEHEDPVIRGLAERLQEAEKRLGTREAEAREDRVGRQLAKDTADFDAVQNSYTIGGKPMSDAQVEAVEDYILKNPEVGSRLSIEQVTRVVYPDAVKVGPKSPSAKGPGDSLNGKGSPVATIVDEGSAGGAPAGPWKPRANETIESAVQEAGRRLGWKR